MCSMTAVPLDVTVNVTLRGAPSGPLVSQFPASALSRSNPFSACSLPRASRPAPPAASRHTSTIRALVVFIFHPPRSNIKRRASILEASGPPGLHRHELPDLPVQGGGGRARLEPLLEDCHGPRVEDPLLLETPGIEGGLGEVAQRALEPPADRHLQPPL